MMNGRPSPSSLPPGTTGDGLIKKSPNACAARFTSASPDSRIKLRAEIGHVNERFVIVGLRPCEQVENQVALVRVQRKGNGRSLRQFLGQRRKLIRFAGG